MSVYIFIILILFLLNILFCLKKHGIISLVCFILPLLHSYLSIGSCVYPSQHRLLHTEFCTNRFLINKFVELRFNKISR